VPTQLADCSTKASSAALSREFQVMLDAVSKCAFRMVGAVFIAVWLFSLAKMSLQKPPSRDDLIDAALEAAINRTEEVRLRKLRLAHAGSESRGKNSAGTIGKATTRKNSDRPGRTGLASINACDI
jgi:hypothetical protein